MVIQLVVEGKGEISAARELLSRLMNVSQRWDFTIARPIRQNSSQLLKPEGIRKAINLALQTDDLAAILVIFDGDIDILREDGTETCFCPKEDLAPLLAAAKEVAGSVSCEIVVPCREFETWLLAGVEGLVASGHVKPDSACPPNLENIRGAKERLAKMLGHSYLPTSNQASLTNSFDLKLAYRRTRSFKKMVKAFGELHSAFGAPISVWPPEDWLE